MTTFPCPYCVVSDEGEHAADCPNNPAAETMTAEWPPPTTPPDGGIPSPPRPVELPAEPAISPPPLPPLASAPVTRQGSFLWKEEPRIVEWAAGRGELLGFVRWETGTTYAIVNSEGNLFEVAVSEVAVVEE